MRLKLSSKISSILIVFVFITGNFSPVLSVFANELPESFPRSVITEETVPKVDTEDGNNKEDQTLVLGDRPGRITEEAVQDEVVIEEEVDIKEDTNNNIESVITDQSVQQYYVNNNKAIYTNISLNREYSSIDNKFQIKFNELPQSVLAEGVNLTIEKQDELPVNEIESPLSAGYKVTTTPELMEGTFSATIEIEVSKDTNYAGLEKVEVKYSENGVNYTEEGVYSKVGNKVSFSVDHFTTFVVTPLNDILENHTQTGDTTPQGIISTLMNSNNMTVQNPTDTPIDINITSPVSEGQYFKDGFDISAEFNNDFDFSGIYVDLIDPTLPAVDRTIERCNQNGTIAPGTALSCTIDSNAPTNLTGTDLVDKAYSAKFTGFQRGDQGDGFEFQTLFRGLFIDNTRPVFSNNNLVDDTTHSGVITATVDAVDPDLTDGNPGSGINPAVVRVGLFEYLPGGGVTFVPGSWTAMTNIGGDTWETSFDTTQYPDGVYQLRYNTRDNVDNRINLRVNDFVIDNNPPEVIDVDMIVNGVSSRYVTAGDDVTIQVVSRDVSGISTVRDNRFWMANVANNWAAGVDAQRIQTGVFNCVETDPTNFESTCSFDFTMPGTYQNGDVITTGFEEQYFNFRVYDTLDEQTFFGATRFTYYNPLNAPSMLGFNVNDENIANSFPTPRPNVELACSGKTFINGVSSHWTDVNVPDYFESNLKYQRQFQRPAQIGSTNWSGNEIYNDAYTNYRSFGGGAGNEGTYNTRVRAFIDLNNNNQLDIATEPFSDLSGDCQVTYQLDDEAPVILSLAPDLSSPVNGAGELSVLASDAGRGDYDLENATVVITDSTNTEVFNSTVDSVLDNSVSETFIFNYDDLADGVYSVRVCASDIAGNIGDGTDITLPTGDDDTSQECFETSMTVLNATPQIRIDNRTINEGSLETYTAISAQSSFVPDVYSVRWSIRKSNQANFFDITQATGVNGLSLNTATYANILQNFDLFDPNSNFFLDDPINPFIRVELIRNSDNQVMATDFAQITLQNINPTVSLTASSGGTSVTSADGATPTLNINAGDTVSFSGDFSDPAGNFDAGPGWDARMNFGGTGFFSQNLIQANNTNYNVGITPQVYASGVYNAVLRVCEEGNLYGFCSTANITIAVAGVATGGDSGAVDNNPADNIGAIGTPSQPQGEVLGVGTGDVLGTGDFEISLASEFSAITGNLETFTINLPDFETSELANFLCVWDMGDGQEIERTGIEASSVEYIYEEAGTYELNVNCNNSENNTSASVASLVNVTDSEDVSPITPEIAGANDEQSDNSTNNDQSQPQVVSWWGWLILVLLGITVGGLGYYLLRRN